MIREAMDQYAAVLDRKFAHDRTKTVGASEIGLCARRTYWTKADLRNAKEAKKKKNGVKPDVKKAAAFRDGSDPAESTWGARVRGTIMENHFIQPALKKKYGSKLLLSGKSQRSLKGEYLSATPDALAIDQPRNALIRLGVKDLESDCFLIEIKTIDPRVNLVEVKAENAAQVQVQLGMVRRLTKHKPMYAVVMYVDASFWSEVDEYVVRYDEELFKRSELRAKLILSADSPNELKPEGYISGGKECEWCPWTKECGVMRRGVPTEEAAADPQFVAEVVDMCKVFNAAKMRMKADSKVVKEIEVQIKDRLREKNVRKIPGVVTWSTVKGRTSYDYEAFFKAARDLGLKPEDYSTAGEPTDRMQVHGPAAEVGDGE